VWWEGQHVRCVLVVVTDAAVSRGDRSCVLCADVPRPHAPTVTWAAHNDLCAHADVARLLTLVAPSSSCATDVVCVCVYVWMRVGV
jgi:hypothetical protein